MATAIVMPRLSDTMTEGKIVKWHKKEGDPVSSGEAVADVETDKATLELEAYEDGTLLKIVTPEGSSAALGATVGILGRPGEDISGLLAPPAPGLAPKAEPAKPEVPAAAPKLPEKPRVVAVAPPAAPLRPEPPRPPPAEPTPEAGRIKASPLARRLAHERGVDLGRVAGTGPSGRVVAKDVEEALRRPPAEALAPAAPAVREAPPFLALPTPPEAGLHELTGMRKVIATRTAQAWREVPHFYLTVDVDMESCMALRAELKSLGVSLSVNDFILKAAAVGLRKVPEVNRSYEGDAFRQHARIDVGMAVALPDGLVAPVLHDADQLSLSQIAAAARDLSERTRTKRLKPEEYAGGSVTVSNLGMFGIDAFYAVINPPQSAILSVGAVAQRPVVHDGAVVARQRMWLSLSGDHRAIDGALGARYLAAVKEALERPVVLMV